MEKAIKHAPGRIQRIEPYQDGLSDDMELQR